MHRKKSFETLVFSLQPNFVFVVVACMWSDNRVASEHRIIRWSVSQKSCALIDQTENQGSSIV